MSGTIGVLALQGGFREHGAHLRDCGIEPVYVREPGQLACCSGLIIPGGESSCLRRLMRGFGLDTAIVEAVCDRGLKVWGTCAGAILCADEVEGEEPCLSLIEASVARNIFGSQLSSFTEEVALPFIEGVQRLVYIRAPGIRRVWGGTKALHTSHGVITAAENVGVLVTSFHPELSGGLGFHTYFIRKCGLEPRLVRDAAWRPTRWMERG